MFGRIAAGLLLPMFLLCVAEAQQPGKVPRIGLLVSGCHKSRVEDFLQGLRDRRHKHCPCRHASDQRDSDCRDPRW